MALTMLFWIIIKKVIMGFSHKILYEIGVRKRFYQQDRVLLPKVIFFSLNDEEAV